VLFTAAWVAALLLRDHRWWVPVAVRTTAAGEALLAPAITRRLIEELVSGPPPGGTPDELTRLTDRELEVLTLVLGERLFDGALAMMELATVHLGLRLGLYQALQDSGR
jgi:hypothetical protein